ncbi:CPBP family glutamic-type intramembrane protease [Cellulomonas fengjieae]|uniref:CPBP family glutamic-type intramembrane protease n=1 Tax=Cellulomonas fengjieae TaxID=2819978 RepID=UPI001AAE9623|nr:CPBP family glutamic-type intramembrane protease [Cellulomonas fengjieae]MBO3102316.1 CPBP family intramembrane metalloprotease [Cellulomonas fengjieae]
MRNGDGRGRAVARGVLGWLVLGVGLGLAIGVAEAVQRWLSLGTTAAMLLQAVLATVLVVPAIVLLRTRVDHRTLAGLGLARPVGLPIALGLGVGLGVGALVWGPAWLVGWVEVGAVDGRELAWFLVLNTVVLLLFEALPEELALRGYTWTTIRDGWRVAAATLITTALFPLTSAVISATRWVAATLLGSGPSAPTVFPAGSDPVEYVVQLVVFGLVLVAARRIPVRGALLVAIAFHVAQLTVNRLVLGGTGWLSTGADVTLAEPDVILLVLVHLAVSGLVFVLIRRATERRRATASREALVPHGA